MSNEIEVVDFEAIINNTNEEPEGKHIVEICRESGPSKYYERITFSSRFLAMMATAMINRSEDTSATYKDLS